MSLPLIDIDQDLDKHERRDDRHFDENIQQGQGFGIRLSVGHRKPLWRGFDADIGLLYLYGEHRTTTSHRGVYSHSGFAELLGGLVLGDRDLSFSLKGGVGLGGVVLDFKGGFKDSGGAAALTRALIGINLGGRVDLAGSVGYMIFGYPTETIGDGSFISLELGFRF